MIKLTGQLNTSSILLLQNCIKENGIIVNNTPITLTAATIHGTEILFTMDKYYLDIMCSGNIMCMLYDKKYKFLKSINLQSPTSPEAIKQGLTFTIEGTK